VRLVRAYLVFDEQVVSSCRFVKTQLCFVEM
jgi:hypothetical protein